MPEVMLSRDRQNPFRRTVPVKGGKTRVIEFHPGVPVDLKPGEVESLQREIGTILMPIMRNERGQPRFIREYTVSEALDVAQAAG